MRLIRCHIENFGGLHDVTVEFEQNFHLICEPNGWGKSTLAAFIRIMFFGFEGEGKRKGIENERKRFEPWQGGVFGGQITFETGGRTYTAARIFADKKANDSFELRDAATNLKSGDFSENLGEEIFAINGESFARTVFLGQNDCVTGTTDSINAKIGNLTDNMNDLNCYEKASAALQDAQNGLTPRRKTGTLSRLNDEITRMQTEAAQSTSLGDTIRELEGREREARRLLEENRQKQDETFQLTGRVSRAQDALARRREYTQLCDACAQTEEAYRGTEDYFPGEVLSEEELSACMSACDAMDRAAEGMRIYELTPEEADQLAALERADEGTTEKEGPLKKENSKRWLIFLICGIVLAGVSFGVFFGISRFWPWIAAAAAGIVLIAVGLIFRAGDSKKAAREAERVGRMERELAEERSVRKSTLRGKLQSYQNCRSEYEKNRDWIAEQIRRMGLLPEEFVRTQLQEIWRRRIEWQNAKKEAEAARNRKQEFENANDMSFLMENKSEDLPSLEELNDRQRQSENQAEEIRQQADAYRDQLRVLREKYDILAETQENLAAALEKRDRLQKQYDQVKLAGECLTVAKEAMTAKYMDPLMRSFSEYYRIVTGEEAARYRMDANVNLTVDEYGMLRDTACLSRGYQDLIGLCLRFALVDAMYQEEKPFLILDEPLINLDEEKEAGGKLLLEAVSQRYQLICFSCRKNMSL